MTATARTWRLDLPWQRPPLSLNQRLHWAARSRIAQQITRDVLIMARAANLPRGLERVHVTLHWQPDTKRRRDTDNPSPTLKVCLDAAVQFGVVADDDSTHVTSAVVIEPVARPASCWLTIEEVGQ